MLPTQQKHSKAQQTQPQRENSAPNSDLIQIVGGDCGAKDSEDIVDQSYAYQSDTIIPRHNSGQTRATSS